MTRVLLIGIKPEAVDFSDPDLPSGLTAEKIAAGIDVALSDMKARGWEGAFCSILPDDSAEVTIAALLASTGIASSSGWHSSAIKGSAVVRAGNQRH